MLQVLSVRPLQGPNLWSERPVLEVSVAAVPVHGSSVVEFLERLDDQPHTVFPKPPRQVPTAGEALVDLVLLLQRLEGSPVTFGTVRPTEFPHIWTVAIEHEEPEIGRAALDAAIRLLTELNDGIDPSVADCRSLVRDVMERFRCGNRTRLIVEAARRQGIPLVRLDSESLIQLGQGIHRRRVQTGITERTGMIAESVSRDKQLCKELLRSVGLPVPVGRLAWDAEEAVRFAAEIGSPIVVKPRNSDFGNGVSLNLSEPALIRSAWQQARTHSAEVIVERFMPGDWYRLLVVNGRVEAAARRLTPRIVGDGQRTVAGLIELANTDPRRGDGPFCPINPLHVGAVELATLYRQGLGLESVPAAGVEVSLREDAYLIHGATQVDATLEVHPEVAELAIEATELIGLDVAGIDLVSTDISRPLSQTSVAILEVNAEPAFLMHMAPVNEPSRPVADAIVRSLFPHGQTGRLPLMAIVGEVSWSKLAAESLSRNGLFAARVDSKSSEIGQRSGAAGPTDLASRLRAAWLHPHTTAAVVSLSVDDVVREGLPFDQCPILVFGPEFDPANLHAMDVARLLLKTRPRLTLCSERLASSLSTMPPDGIVQSYNHRDQLTPLFHSAIALFIRLARSESSATEPWNHLPFPPAWDQRATATPA